MRKTSGDVIQMSAFVPTGAVTYRFFSPLTCNTMLMGVLCCKLQKTCNAYRNVVTRTFPASQVDVSFCCETCKFTGGDVERALLPNGVAPQVAGVPREKCLVTYQACSKRRATAIPN